VSHTRKALAPPLLPRLACSRQGSLKHSGQAVGTYLVHGGNVLVKQRGLGVPDVQVAAGLGREACDHLAHLCVHQPNVERAPCICGQQAHARRTGDAEPGMLERCEGACATTSVQCREERLQGTWRRVHPPEDAGRDGNS